MKNVTYIHHVFEIANAIPAFPIADAYIVVIIPRVSTHPPKEIIRYIPRSLEEEVREPVKAEEIFKSMFEQQVPWIGSFNDTNVFERRELDKKKGLLGK